MILLANMITNEDGEPAEPGWHYVRNCGGSDVLLCTSEVFGFGEGNATAKTKLGTGRGITCPDCRSLIRELQSFNI